NVGITTLVEFLNRKGHHVESNPNTKISDEQYALLVKEFGKDIPEKGRERVIPERPKRESISIKEEPVTEIKTVVPEEYKPKLVKKGKIDLDKPQQKQQETPEIKKETSSVPVPEVPVAAEVKPVEKIIEQEQKPVEEKEEKQIIVKADKQEEKQAVAERVAEPVTSDTEITNPENQPETTVNAGDDSLFRLNTPKFESKIKVTGKIDLATLNQSTRPKKQTKEE
ncbi:MAG: translation initiation factor IF-2, partial [Tannerellaceae bacterium]|nr:translation initiation factor IF-2 [Tannerellaceae bacterium]